AVRVAVEPRPPLRRDRERAGPDRRPGARARGRRRAGSDGAVVFVGIPRGSRNKYEYDEELGGIVLDRRLFTAMTYPADYGYVEGALGEGGEPVHPPVLRL